MPRRHVRVRLFVEENRRVSVGNVQSELQKVFGRTLSRSTVHQQPSLTAKPLKRLKVQRLSDKQGLAQEVSAPWMERLRIRGKSSSPELMPINSCVFFDEFGLPRGVYQIVLGSCLLSTFAHVGRNLRN